MAHDFRRITAITSCFSASKNHGCCGCSQCREGDSRPGLWSVTTRNTSRDPIKYSVAFDHVICVWWMLDVCRLQGRCLSRHWRQGIKHDQTMSANHVCPAVAVTLVTLHHKTEQCRTTLLKTACSPSHPFIIDIELPSQYEHGYNMLHHVATSKRLPSMRGCAYGRTASSHPMISSIRGWSCRFEPWPLPCCATNFNQDYSDINDTYRLYSFVTPELAGHGRAVSTRPNWWIAREVDHETSSSDSRYLKILRKIAIGYPLVI